MSEIRFLVRQLRFCQPLSLQVVLPLSFAATAAVVVVVVVAAAAAVTVASELLIFVPKLRSLFYTFLVIPCVCPYALYMP